MKAKRQAAIIDLIKEEVIETQAQLATRLQALGFPVTQATVSRDIQELRLIKVPTEEGRYRYALPPQRIPGDLYRRAQMRFTDSVVSLDVSLNLVVIKTHPGEAHAVAAVIDELAWPEVVGTVAGDDSILVIVRLPSPLSSCLEIEQATAKVLAKFQELRR